MHDVKSTSSPCQTGSTFGMPEEGSYLIKANVGMPELNLEICKTSIAFSMKDCCSRQETNSDTKEANC